MQTESKAVSPACRWLSG